METKQHTSVIVTFNGIDKPIAYQPHEALQALLQAAKNEFGVQDQHLLSLFTEDNVELDDSRSVLDAGIKPGQLLILRQSSVRGG